jgi:hypothetical protein
MSRWDDTRQSDPRQTGHRREFDPRRQERQSFTERKERALSRLHGITRNANPEM